MVPLRECACSPQKGVTALDMTLTNSLSWAERVVVHAECVKTESS